MSERLTHRRHEADLSDGWVMLFAVGDANAGYGDHVWELRSELPEVDDDLVRLAIDWYDSQEGIELTEEQARSMLDPANIVGDAGLWDRPEFVADCCIDMAPGYRTGDGAVVIRRDEVEIAYLGRESEGALGY